MSTLRRFGFAIVLGLCFFSGRLAAFSPPEMDCPDGCECEERGTAVEIYCDELDPPTVCGEIWNACEDYCGAFENWLINEMSQYDADCYSLYLTENCQPMGLEAPTETNCQCICWY